VAALHAWESGGRRFLHFPALCGALLDSQRRAEALEAAKRTRFIVLDDFGAEYVKEGGLLEVLVDEIICHREAEILPTIITTNLTRDKLKDRLSDRIIDRFHGGWGRVFAVTGASLRSVVAADGVIV
jgi:DNA replication protein DnaC